MKGVAQLLMIVFFGCTFCTAQDTIKKPKYLSLGSSNFGIGFGNSLDYNGIRFNLWDNEKSISNYNGLNFTFASEGHTLNGLQVGLLVSHMENINGVSIASIWHGATEINGIAASFGYDCKTLNGIFVGFGVATRLLNEEGSSISGVALGGFVNAEIISGLSIGLYKCESRIQNGISIAVFNKTQNLHGLQIGLLNHAENNPKPFKRLPLLNFHL